MGRSAASKFGPEQKKAADAWIKRVASGKEADVPSLLEAQISLFGECLLSEDGSPSKCQKLEEALNELQEVLEASGKATPKPAGAVVGVVVPTGDANAAQEEIVRLA